MQVEFVHFKGSFLHSDCLTLKNVFHVFHVMNYNRVKADSA